MAYGDYSGPDKENKGQENGACNRQRCQAEPATFYNHGSHAWYCSSCKDDIYDAVGKKLWKQDFPEVDYPMFETRQEIHDRKSRA